MSKFEAYQCDKCGNITDAKRAKRAGTVTINPVSKRSTSTSFDLCDKCMSALEEFVELKKILSHK